MRVYGTTIEPGGMELENEVGKTTCGFCGAEADHYTWETLDGGCINRHWRTICEQCDSIDESMFA